MSCRRDEIVSSNWCFKRCCWKVLIPAAKPPGVDTLKRYRKSRHPVQNEMKKGLSELKKRWKADYFGSLCVFFYLFLRTKVMNLCLLYWKEGVDFRGRHVELRLTELDYTLLLDTVVSRLMITIESISGWLAPWIVDSKTIHTQGAHDTITGHQWHIHCRDRFFGSTNKSCHFKYRFMPRIHWAHVEVPVTIQSLLIWYRTGRQWFSIFKSCGARL